MGSTLLTAQDRQTLVNVVYAAFPHSTFPRGPYERAADAVIAEAGTNPRFLAQLLQGLGELDAQRDVPFSELDADTAAAVLRGADGSPFLTAIVDSAVVTLYSDREVWDLLGYEGPSYDKGGYADRGFDDLDWLPDPKIEFEGEVPA
ncbi:hypothetical protein EV188_1094 [Actinomycetospora succinea]|uniref:Gluconate 2-dehydrogenase subunit 3-like protein n=1 Tax=Actinomycetospora succinea TaxID=663603 RepID=A0A4R6UWZ0_9PSEU|nr:hypothetical protein [Actinomycetospora succinea]TDQ50796.1 hypothetical protein EV188_1094 [Actinomycetospora succinea]